MYNGLAGLNVDAPVKGVRVLLRLIESLGPRGKPYATWRFDRLGTVVDEEFETIADKDGLWHIEVPSGFASVVGGDVLHDPSLLDVLGTVRFATAPLNDAIR